MRKRISIVAIISLLFLSSCVTLHEFPIEVFQPPKVTIPSDIQKVTLVSRNLKYINDTLQNYYSKDYKLKKDISPVNIDSLSVQACFDSLSTEIKALSRFSQITVWPVSSLPRQYVKTINSPSKKLIGQISSDTNAEAVILLDMYSSFYSIYPNPDNGRSIAQVVTASIWTIYDPSSYRIRHHTSMVDTLYWDGLDEHQKYQASRIPDKKAALQIAAGLAGVKYSKNIVPSWATVKRNTLSFNHQDFKKAAHLAQMNKWEEASALWSKYSESSRKRAQVQALYNLAVASEMNGDIDTANDLIQRASKISALTSFATESNSIRKYAAVLAIRKMELNKINSMNENL